jgi:hypothetical protein
MALAERGDFPRRIVQFDQFFPELHEGCDLTACTPP